MFLFFNILANSDEDQIVNGKQYSDKRRSKFSKLFFNWYEIDIIVNSQNILIPHIFFLACGEHKLKEKIKNTKNDTVTKTKGPSCTSVVISDRFVVTSASCLAG